MPTADYSSYHQNTGTTSDGAKFNNLIDAIQATINGLDSNNITSLLTSKLTGTYQTYTPAITATGGSPTLGNATTVIARYLQIGNLVHVMGQFVFGSTTSLGTGTAKISLPVNCATSNSGLLGHVYGFDTSAAAMALGGAIYSATGTFSISQPTTWNGTVQSFTGTTPWTWAAGDEIHWNLLYEAA